MRDGDGEKHAGMQIRRVRRCAGDRQMRDALPAKVTRLRLVAGTVGVGSLLRIWRRAGAVKRRVSDVGWRVEWIDDSLSDLVAVRAREETCDEVMRAAVRMHWMRSSVRGQCREWFR